MCIEGREWKAREDCDNLVRVAVIGVSEEGELRRRKRNAGERIQPRKKFNEKKKNRGENGAGRRRPNAIAKGN